MMKKEGEGEVDLQQVEDQEDEKRELKTVVQSKMEVISERKEILLRKYFVY